MDEDEVGHPGGAGGGEDHGHGWGRWGRRCGARDQPGKYRRRHKGLKLGDLQQIGASKQRTDEALRAGLDLLGKLIGQTVAADRWVLHDALGRGCDQLRGRRRAAAVRTDRHCRRTQGRVMRSRMRSHNHHISHCCLLVIVN